MTPVMLYQEDRAMQFLCQFRTPGEATSFAIKKQEAKKRKPLSKNEKYAAHTSCNLILPLSLLLNGCMVPQERYRTLDTT